jgi:hypothetical protein
LHPSQLRNHHNALSPSTSETPDPVSLPSTVEVNDMNGRLVLVAQIAVLAGSLATPERRLPAQPPLFDARPSKEHLHDWLILRDKSWCTIARDAGKPSRGLVLSARGMLNTGDFKTAQLVVSVKNISEVPAFFPEIRGIEQHLQILVRDKNQSAVALSDTGVHRLWEPADVGGMRVTLFPGEAIGFVYPIGVNYAISKNGPYTVLPFFGVGRERLVAPPAVIQLSGEPAPAREMESRKSSQTGLSGDFTTLGRGVNRQWSTLIADAGKVRHGCVLEAAISPYSPNSVHLVVSLVHVQSDDHRSAHIANPIEDAAVGDRAPGGDPSEITVNVGRSPSNYRIIVRDAGGNLLGMTEFGRKFLGSRLKELPHSLRLGSAIGAWFPLDAMFHLKPHEEYTVLAVLRGLQQRDDELVSAPIKIRVPDLQIAGINRPFYGSERIWPKLCEIATNADRFGPIQCSIEERQAGQRFAITLHKRDNQPFGDELQSVLTTILVRDDRGKPVSPVETDAKSSPSIWILPHSIPESDFIAPADKKALILIDILNSYPFMVDQPYQLLAALTLKGKKPTMVVAPLAKITVGPTWTFSTTSTAKERNNRPSPCESARPEQSTSGNDWDDLVRFAGRPFDDLVLRAEQPTPAELKVSLVNLGVKSIAVTKWEGIAGYEVQVRDAEGRRVPLREKGKVESQSGALLDSRDLKPQESIEETIPLRDLFDLPPGDYSVLLSLPIIGDVDAIMTAAPLKVRIAAKSSPGNK